MKAKCLFPILLAIAVFLSCSVEVTLFTDADADQEGEGSGTYCDCPSTPKLYDGEKYVGDVVSDVYGDYVSVWVPEVMAFARYRKDNHFDGERMSTVFVLSPKTSIYYAGPSCSGEAYAASLPFSNSVLSDCDITIPIDGRIEFIQTQSDSCSAWIVLPGAGEIFINQGSLAEPSVLRHHGFDHGKCIDQDSLNVIVYAAERMDIPVIIFDPLVR